MGSANVCYNLVGFLSDAVRSLDRASAVPCRVVKKSLLGMLFLKIFWFEDHRHQKPCKDPGDGGVCWEVFLFCYAQEN